MTNVVEQAFWELLKAGLWERQPMMEAKLSEEQWAEVIKHAKQQTLIGVLFDGMLKLPFELHPNEETRMKWFWIVNKIERANRLQNHVLVEFVMKLREKDVRALLLKGQSYAALYPNPLHRQCGDIDLYIGQKNYPKVCEWVKKCGMIGSKNVKNFHHQEIKWQGVNMDLHRVTIAFSTPSGYKRLIRWSEQMLANSQSFFTPSTEKEEIPIPEVSFNVFFVFIHLLKHFLYEGVGLRQLCDWARMLHVYHDKIDQEELKLNLKHYGLTHAWQVFGFLLVQQIGLPQNEFPFYKNTQKKSAKILRVILQRGNFGHYAENQVSNNSNYLVRKTSNFFFHINCYLKGFCFFPSLAWEAFMFYLYQRIGPSFTDYFKNK
ncbi:MAG: nucleotidyltransferase family protein [Bacteroidaceae bacterium]|nr:nucleotidyltransferase family protein [Bacteroidaceae bacterium]